jgi:hypothetical protein
MIDRANSRFVLKQQQQRLDRLLKHFRSMRIKAYRCVSDVVVVGFALQRLELGEDCRRR